MSGINDKIKGRSILGMVLTGPDGQVKVKKVVDDEGEKLTNEYIITKEFSSANEFSIWVEKQHAELTVPRMDIIIQYCVDRDIDIESVAPLINRALKERIREEAEEANMMKKTARLPL